MALTDAQQVSIRRHLGMNSAAAVNYPFIETFFSVGIVLESLPPATEAEVVAILARLTALETRIDEAPRRLKASAVGSIDLNPGELRALRGELARWRGELTLLGLPLNSGAGGVVVT